MSPLPRALILLPLFLAGVLAPAQSAPYRRAGAGEVIFHNQSDQTIRLVEKAKDAALTATLTPEKGPERTITFAYAPEVADPGAYGLPRFPSIQTYMVSCCRAQLEIPAHGWVAFRPANADATVHVEFHVIDALGMEPCMPDWHEQRDEELPPGLLSQTIALTLGPGGAAEVSNVPCLAFRRQGNVVSFYTSSFEELRIPCWPFTPYPTPAQIRAAWEVPMPAESCCSIQ